MTLPPVRPDDPDADAPEWWRRTATYRRIPLLVMIVLVVIFVVAEQGTPAPKLATNCHLPAFALSTYSTQQHAAVQWSMTGVPGHTYDLTAVPVSHSGPAASPVIATLTETVTMPSDCTATGTFGVLLSPGTWEVAVREPPGQSPVTAPRKFVVTAQPG